MNTIPVLTEKSRPLKSHHALLEQNILSYFTSNMGTRFESLRSVLYGKRN